jgi:mannose-6-phosphate isomerase-like protein (cupin superfamily)
MTRRPPRIVHLDEIEAIPGPGTLTWRPVRAHLGLRAFGTNAYTAASLGDDVVEPHDENPDLAHEELYFVARGRARFILDGESFDAPAGTYVFVPDPATHRHAVAEEVGTTVLSFGGPPTFEPSAWEWMFRAVALTESDPAQAREIVEDGIEKHPESPGLRIALARVLLGEGDEDGARAALREALERQPDAEDYVRQDAALSALL